MSEVSKSTDKQIDNPQLQNVDGVTTEIGVFKIGNNEIVIVQNDGSPKIRSKSNNGPNPQNTFDEMATESADLEEFLKDHKLKSQQLSKLKAGLVSNGQEINGNQEVNYQKEIDMLDDRINATKNIDDQRYILQDALENFLNSNLDKDLKALKKCKQRFDKALEEAKVLDVDVSDYKDAFNTQIQQTIKSLLSDKDKTYQHTDDQLDQAGIKWLNRANGILKLCKEIDLVSIDDNGQSINDLNEVLKSTQEQQKDGIYKYYNKQLNKFNQEHEEYKTQSDDQVKANLKSCIEIFQVHTCLKNLPLLDDQKTVLDDDNFTKFADNSAKIAESGLASAKTTIDELSGNIGDIRSDDAISIININQQLKPAVSNLHDIHQLNEYLSNSGKQDIDTQESDRRLCDIVGVLTSKVKNAGDVLGNLSKNSQDISTKRQIRLYKNFIDEAGILWLAYKEMMF